MKRLTTRSTVKAQFAAVAILVAATFVLGSAEQANAQYYNQNSNSVMREKLIGGWGFVQQMKDGSEWRISFTLASNGQYAGWSKLTKADGQSEEHTIYGTWSVQGSTLIVTSDYGPVRHAFRFDGKKLNLHLPVFDSTLTFVPAGVYVVGPDGKRRVVDRV